MLEGLVSVLDPTGVEVRMQMVDVQLLPAKSRKTITNLLAQRNEDLNAEIQRQVEIRRNSMLPKISDDIKALETSISGKSATLTDIGKQISAKEAEKQRLAERNATAVEKATAVRDRIEAERNAILAKIARAEAENSSDILARREKIAQDKAKTEIAVLARQQDIYNLEQEMQQAVSLVETRKIQDTAIPDKAIADAKAKLDETRTRLRETLDAKAAELAKMYASRMMSVTNQVDDTLAPLGITRTCFRIVNRGNKAISSLTLDLIHNGKSAREAGINLTALTGLPDLTTPSLQLETGSRKVVIGIPPGMAWPATPLCFEINEAYLPDDAKNILKPGSPWNVAITTADVARPDSLSRAQKPENSPLAKETWYFTPVAASEIFSGELRAMLPQMQPTHDIAAARKAIANNTRLRNILQHLRTVEKRKVQQQYQQRILAIRQEKEKLASHYLQLQTEAAEINIAGNERVKLAEVTRRLDAANLSLSNETEDVGEIDDAIASLNADSARIRQDLQQDSAQKAQLQARLQHLRLGGPDAEQELKAIVMAEIPQDILNARWHDEIMSNIRNLSGIRTIKTNRDGFFHFDNVRQTDGFIMISIPKDQSSSYFWLEPLPSIRFVKLDSSRAILLDNKNFQPFFDYLAKVTNWRPTEQQNIKQ